MTLVSFLQFLGLGAMAAALIRLTMQRPQGLLQDLRTPLLLLASLAFVKYAVNGVEWLSATPRSGLDHIEDYLDSIWPAAWFLLFFASRLSLSKRDLQAAHARLEDALTRLKETQEQAARDERLKALGRMTSGIAHDFNNNLQPILGYTELLLEEVDRPHDPEACRTALETIYRSASHAAETVRRLQTFYGQRSSAQQLQPVDPSEIIAQAVHNTRHAWKDQAQAEGREIEVRTALAFQGSILAHPAQFSDVLTNLILNAVDALPQGGVIELRSARRGDDMVLEVTDNGIGMSSDVLEHCLDPFFTTKGEAAKGTGLGLSLAYGILEKMEANLAIHSAPGRGTTITISAPVCNGTAATEPAPVSLVGAALQILLIDDDDSVRHVVGQMLATAGHAVTSAPDAEDGWRRFERQPFDVVITDHAMPHGSGLELAGRMKDRRPETPIILLTGYGLLMHAKGERPDPVDAVVAKPVNRDELARALAVVARR